MSTTSLTLVQNFLKYLETEKAATRSTLKAYQADLTQYLGFFGTSRVHPSDITAADINTIRRFLEQVRLSGRKDITIKRKHACLRSLYRWMKVTKIISTNPTDDLRPPHVEVGHTTNLLSEEQIEVLLKLPTKIHGDGSLLGLRDEAILRAMYCAGISLNELSLLTCGDLEVIGDSAKIRVNGRCHRTIALLGEAAHSMLTYHRVRGLVFGNFKPEDPLFVDANNKGDLSNRSMRRNFRRYLKAMGVSKDISPTALRYAFMMKLRRDGATPRAIRKVLGQYPSSSPISRLPALS